MGLARAVFLLFLVFEGVLATPRIEESVLRDFDTSELSEQQVQALVALSKLPNGSTVLGALANHFRFHKRITGTAIMQLLSPIFGRSRTAKLEAQVDEIARGLFGCKEPTQFRDNSGECVKCRRPCVAGSEVQVSDCSAFADRICRPLCEPAAGRSGGQFMSSAGKCVPCVNCADGMSMIMGCDGVHNRVCEDCPHGQDARGEVFQCTTCPAGFFQPQIGTPCQPCATVAPCPQGTGVLSECSPTTNRVCGACRQGEFLDSGVCVRCYVCEPGTAPKAGSNCPKSKLDCEACPVGTASEGGNQPCTTCANKKYSNAVGASTCRDCPVDCGPFAIQTKTCGGASDLGCSPCLDGQFVKDNKCETCVARIGSPTRVHVTPAGKCDECTPCPRGYGSICKNGVEESCAVCPTGTFSSAGIDCVACSSPPSAPGAGGKFAKDRTECLDCAKCGAGRYMVRECTALSDRVCKECPAGTKSSETETTCQDCPVGHGSSAGASECTKCSDSFFSDRVGGVCRPHRQPKVGEFVSKSGDSTTDNILECDAGYYRAPDKSCRECPAGWYKSAKGDDACCVPCGKCTKGEDSPCTKTKNAQCKRSSVLTTGALATSGALVVLILLTLVPASKWMTPPRGAKHKGQSVLHNTAIALIVISLTLALLVAFGAVEGGGAVACVTLSAVAFLGAILISVMISKGGTLIGFQCQPGQFIHSHSCADCLYNDERPCSKASKNLLTEECTGTTKHDASACYCPDGMGVHPLAHDDYAQYAGTMALNELIFESANYDYLCSACPRNTKSKRDATNWFNICEDCAPSEFSGERASECQKCGSLGAFLSGVSDELKGCPMQHFTFSRERFVEKCEEFSAQGVDPTKVYAKNSIVSCGCAEGKVQQVEGDTFTCKDCPANTYAHEEKCEGCPAGYFAPEKSTKCETCGSLGRVLALASKQPTSVEAPTNPLPECPRKWIEDSKDSGFPAPFCTLAESGADSDLVPNSVLRDALDSKSVAEGAVFDCDCRSSEFEFVEPSGLYPAQDDSWKCVKRPQSLPDKAVA